ncbi:MAG TPA: histidinol-phosphate aminotransferase [Ruminococcaceae bacterium]|nr:histidinol-phosphate aminotransferase [Oscillospiraceae bacterium]
MPYELTPKIKSLRPYVVDGNAYKIRLDANESFLPLPERMRQAVLSAVGKVSFNRYPDPAAAEVCALYADYCGIDPALLTAGNGSDELISLLVAAFTQKGDKIVTLEHDFSMYDFYAHLAECKVVKVRKNDDFTVDIDRVIETVRDFGAKMVIFSNPCNPTSLGTAKEAVLKLVKSVDALVVLDEAYMDFWDQSLLDVLTQHDNLVILRTCSKMMSAAAVRLGFAVANPAIRNALQAAKSPYNVNGLTQAAAAALLSHRDWIARTKQAVLDSKAALYLESREIAGRYGVKVLTSRTNFVTWRLPKAAEVFRRLRQRGILVRCLGGELLRVTCGTPEENAGVCAALDEILPYAISC